MAGCIRATKAWTGWDDDFPTLGARFGPRVKTPQYVLLLHLTQ